jgi:hypothetical protein
MRRADLEESESLDTTQTSISSPPIIDHNITPETLNYQILEEVECTKVTSNEDATVEVTSEQTTKNAFNQNDDDTPLIDVHASIRTLGTQKTTERPQTVLRRSTRVKKPPDLQRH